MAEKTTLANSAGEIIYPYSMDECIFDTNGNRLDNKIKEIKDTIGNLANKNEIPTVPTKVSELTNDTAFVNKTDVLSCISENETIKSLENKFSEVKVTQLFSQNDILPNTNLSGGTWHVATPDNLSYNTVYITLPIIYQDSDENVVYATNLSGATIFYYVDLNGTNVREGNTNIVTGSNGYNTFTIPSTSNGKRITCFRITVNVPNLTNYNIASGTWDSPNPILVKKESEWSNIDDYTEDTIKLNVKILEENIKSKAVTKDKLANDVLEYIESGSDKPTEYKGNEITVFKKGCAIGDSMTKGTFNHNESGTTAYTENVDYSYPTYLTKISGIDMTNYGIGGKTSVEWVSLYEERFGTNALSGFDFAIIQEGINDAIYSVTSENTKTALQTMVNTLKSKNKGIKIFIATIVPNYYEIKSYDYDSVNDVIKAVVEENDDCYLIDLSTYSNCHRGSAYDNGHLTAIGYNKLANEYISYISYIIAKNINDFKYVQFIGTDYSQS